MLYTGSTLACVLLLLIFFTYAYHLALALAVVTFLLLGFMLTKQSSDHVTVSKFEVNSQGLCSFEGNKHYQLQPSSRFGFLGCWLILQPLTAQPTTAVNAMLNMSHNRSKTMFFIYRDSLSKQDFSRLSNVIAQLNHSP